MSTIAKEWLQQKIAGMEAARDEIPFGLDEDDCNTLAALRIALASLEAEPVGYMNKFTGCVFTLEEQPGADTDAQVYVPVYTAPPAPVSMKDHQIRELVNELRDIAVEYHGTQQLRERIARTVRAAMLQGAEPVTTAYKLPMQPLVIDAHGTLRFKENPIVRALLDYATEHGYGLNEIAIEEFDAENQMQLAQLIGYSLSGYGTLSYVTDESYERAAAAAPQQEVK